VNPAPADDRRSRPPRRPARQKRTAVRLVRSFAILLGVSYAGFLTLAATTQDRFVYPGAWILARRDLPPLDNCGEVLQRRLAGDPSQVVEAIFLPPRAAAGQSPAPLLVIFHGNAELADDYLAEAKALASRGYAVLLPEYRGFGRSGGSPGMAAIRDDAVAFLDEALADERVDPQRVAYIGRSLGGAVASDLATVRPPRALVLESTFKSMRAMLRRAYVPGFLTKQPYDPERDIRAYAGPLMLMHGANDPVVPVSHGRALAAARPDAIYLEPDAGHYPCSDWSGYNAALRDFLVSTGVAPAPAADSAIASPR